MDIQLTATVNPQLHGSRLDSAAAYVFPDYSRSQLCQWIKCGRLLLDGRIARPRDKVSTDDCLTLLPDHRKKVDWLAEPISLNVVFEDEHVIVLNKPAGLVVHPAAGNQSGTLVNALLYHCKELSGIGGVERPGIVHRLDKDTSGCIVAAKSDASHKALVEDFSNRNINKKYLAVVDGLPAINSGRIENYIARDTRDRQKMSIVQPPRGKIAITEYETKIESREASLVQCNLLTGRTHQIRVHMKSLGNPILGDPIYSRISKQKIKVERLMLHAWKLGFSHPITGAQLEFKSDLPKAFSQWAEFN